MLLLISNIILLGVITICLYTDLKERKIYNKITFTTIIVALGINLLTSGSTGLLFSLKGLLVALVMMIVPFVLGGIGAGDVKLLMAIGAIKGAYFVFYATLATFLVGGVIALGILIRKRILLATIKRIVSSFAIIMVGKFNPSLLDGANQSLRISFPYGVAIFSGTIVTLLVV